MDNNRGTGRRIPCTSQAQQKPTKMGLDAGAAVSVMSNQRFMITFVV